MSALPSGLGDLVRASGALIKDLTLPGPVATDFLLCRDPFPVLNGPAGSGKTTTCIMRALYSAARVPPDPSDGVRKYKLGIIREGYDPLWKTTIRSWQKILPADLPGSSWTGSSPRSATHVIHFKDAFGPIRLTAEFLAFGDGFEPDDLVGYEFTDVWLSEINKQREDVFINLADRIGREPPRKILQRGGRIFGDCNAPEVTNWVYRTWWEDATPGFRLFRQPGGLHPDAENIHIVGRDYYSQQIQQNVKRPWHIRRQVHNLPGFARDVDVVFSGFDDERMMSTLPLDVHPELTLVIGVDGGLTPAALFGQATGDGQCRVLAEVALERGGSTELAEAINAMLAESRFSKVRDVIVICDPACGAGADTKDGSFHTRLAAATGLNVRLASTNDPDVRVTALASFMSRALPGGRPGLIVDPSIKAFRRGCNQTYHYHKNSMTGERMSFAKTPDSHVCEAGQYMGLGFGHAQAVERRRTRAQERAASRANRGTRGYDPMAKYG